MPFWNSCLPIGIPAGTIMPPRKSFLSHRIGRKPRCASVMAARQPAGPAPDDNDLAPGAGLRGVLHAGRECLAAAARVHRAAADIRRQRIHAVHARQAVADEILTAGPALVDPVRVADRGAAERDQIALALADDRVHIGRVLEVAARGNGDGHRILDDLGVFDLPALGDGGRRRSCPPDGSDRRRR